jgi:signal transduction histidine kinase/CheY-like chemotaxis protein
VKDIGSEWHDESRELMLACDAAGAITWADARAEDKLEARPGRAFVELAAPGGEDKARVLLERGRSDKVKDSELSVLMAGKVATLSFCAKPDGEGGVLLLASCLPEDHARTLQQMQESMHEVVDLNRQVSRHRRELQQQKAKLEVAYRELDESSRGVIGLHAELEDKAASLKRAADVKGRVVANVSHEFRTPLHTILGLSKILLDASDGPLSEEQQKQVRFIRTSAEELQHLVNDLLDLSKAESGKMQLRPEKFTLEALFAAMRGQMRPLVTPNQGVELVFEPPADDIALETDQPKVAQIVRNLISNALKFTERGEVRITAARHGDEVIIKVTDTGIGIAPTDFDRIFEEFGQIDSDIQKRVRGTGLGLPLSRRLAELLDGSLTVESSLGAGSTFTLTIPAVHPEVRELATIVARPLDPTKAPVLVVEDDRKTIFIYEKYLSLGGFQVLPARTIADARRLLQAHRPSAIVLDVMLEGETTWDFLSELKRDPETSDIPVLVVTVTNKAQKARALGADEFWLKPIDQDRLIKKLKAVARPGLPTSLLVIDDDERARYLIRKLLDDTPFSMIEAATGPAGIHLAQELRPHVIFLDFLLEDMTAFDVLDELKADPRTRSIPVIVVTSHVLDAGERERLAAETEAILSKESLSRELAINRIRDALRKAGVGSSHG